MAESKNNIITHGLSGKIGELIVFSQRDCKTYVSKAPKNKTLEDSPKQKEHKLKFQRATLYAKSVINNSDLKQMYSAKEDNSKGMSTYNVAMKDFFNAPEIKSIDITAYKGKKGDLIKIIAVDDFAVKVVSVKMENADGSLIEEGTAIDSGYEWIYTATTNTTDLTGNNHNISNRPSCQSDTSNQTGIEKKYRGGTETSRRPHGNSPKKTICQNDKSHPKRMAFLMYLF